MGCPRRGYPGGLRAILKGALALAATDPDRAERIANTIADEYSKALALSSIAQALAATSA